MATCLFDKCLWLL